MEQKSMEILVKDVLRRFEKGKPGIEIRESTYSCFSIGFWELTVGMLRNGVLSGFKCGGDL